MNKIVSTKDIVSVSNNNKVIAIGETGIDLYHSKEHVKAQYKSFENHIEACLMTKLPLIIHQRNSENEIIDILKNNHNIDLENEKLAIYLSENKENTFTFTDSNYNCYHR